MLKNITTISKSMRLPFLILTPVSIFLGIATAISSSADISLLNIFLILIGGLMAHISVNTFNEYYDFKTGLDAKTIKTPFSGGSGGLIDNPDAALSVFYVAVASLALTTLIGFYFVFTLGGSIIPLGVLGILTVVTYTQWLNKHPFLCLIAPGLGFGVLMVVGTHWVLTGEYSMSTFWVSLVPFFLVNNLLLLNQFPDIEADKSIGRRHFPIIYGINNSIRLYAGFVIATYSVVIIGILTGTLPLLSSVCLIPLTITISVFWGVNKYVTAQNTQANGTMDNLDKLIPYLGMNVLTTILTPLVLGFSILFS